MKFKLLLVDDDVVDIRVFKRALDKAQIGGVFMDVPSAEEAEQVLRQQTFDCIFLDFQLPKTDGLSLLRKLRSQGIETPTVIITSQGDEMLAVEMMKTGAFDYITKEEVKPDKLRKILSNVAAFHNLILERRKTERKLKRTTQNLAEAQKLARLGSWEYEISDLETGYWSDETYKLLGINPEEHPYPSLHILVKAFEPQEQKRLQEAIEQVIEQHGHCETECSLNLDEQQLWLLMRVRAMPNEYGVFDRIVGTLLDITDRKNSEEQLHKARKAAEEAALAKSEFLSNMSHEIRTPMNAIMGLTELLLKEDLPPKVGENLKLIQYSADNLLVIINDVLDYSKIEAGKITLEQIDFSLRQVMQNLVDTLQFKAESKGITLLASIDENLPPRLQGDPYRINQIILNLLSNAIKFTAQGTVTLQAKLVTTRPNDAEIEISVQDTGIGIPADKLDTIFESFSQAQSSTTRTHGGTGLGLPITKRLIEMQGGQIQVDSEPGRGSTFSFNLVFPLGKSTGSESSNKSHPDKISLLGVKILVAEDNPVNQMLIRQILQNWGVETTLADDGYQVLEEAQAENYDLIFMDLQMPELNGFEATQKLRKLNNPALKEVPIIALTADVMRETKVKVLESGFNDLVTKPFKSDQLLLVIQQHLQKQNA